MNHATFSLGDKITHVPHIGLEITALYGEIRAGKANLSGSVVNGDGQVFSGRFIAGENPICVTAEITLEEWVPE